MIGPIYLLEWQQAKRRAGRWPWRWIYVGVLLLEAALVGYEMTVRTWGQRDPLEFEAVMGLLLVWLHIQQLGIILLVAPAFAAGSITDEKRLGTLDFLLCAPLGSGEIIVSARVKSSLVNGWRRRRKRFTSSAPAYSSWPR